MNLVTYLSKASLAYPFYGVHAPAPLGSVAVSLERDLFKKMTEVSDIDQIIISRRLAKYDRSIALILQLINKNKDTDFLFLELAYNHYLLGNVTLSREALNQVLDQQSEIFIYFQAIILNSFNQSMCTVEVLLNNPLLYLRAHNIFKQKISEEEFTKKIKDISDDKKILILLTAIQTASIGKSKIREIFFHYGALLEKHIVHNHKFIDKLIEITGINDVIKLLKIDKNPILSPDVIHSIYRELPEHRGLFDPSLVFRGSKFLNIERTRVMRHVLLSEDLIRDQNTSDNATRFYSLNLHGDIAFREIENKARTLLKQYVCEKEQIKGLLNKQAIDVSQADVWFDMSVTYGCSKIEDHIHTAAAGNLYLATLVWYANIPDDLGKDDGNIIIKLGCPHSDQIRIAPKNNDYVIFPPWFAHGTTPTDSSEPRVTFNFDLYVNLGT